MPARRKLDFSKVTDMPVTKRVKRLEAKVKAQRPEMKTLVTTINLTAPAGSLATPVNLTNMLQGDGVSNRAGVKIKVWRLEIRGLSPYDVDNYVIQYHGPSATAITAADFTGTVGAFIQPDKLNTRFTEWLHNPSKVDGNGNNRWKMIQKFPSGITVKYDGNTATAVQNGLAFLLLNGSADPKSTLATACIWYTDA